jgi:MarR-like DNA-binding transcriptional regulator SgrR of sgrS sRNA
LEKKNVIDLRDKKFVMIGRGILENTDYFERPSDKLVYVMLCMFANNETKTSYPSAQRLADLCNCSERSVRTSLKRLKEIGLIDIQPRYREDKGRTSNLYVILEPPPMFNL